MERRSYAIIGKSGFGKSRLARTLLAGEMRYIVVNQRQEKFEYPGEAFYDFDTLVDYTFSKRESTFRAVWKGGQDFASDIFNLAFGLGQTLIVLEEADLIPCEGYYREAVFRGRDPAGISIMAIAQTKGMLDLEFRSQVTDVYAFNSHEPSAQNWMSVFFPPDWIDELPHLAPLRGFHWSLQDDAAPITRRIILPR